MEREVERKCPPAARLYDRATVGRPPTKGTPERRRDVDERVVRLGKAATPTVAVIPGAGQFLRASGTFNHSTVGVHDRNGDARENSSSAPSERSREKNHRLQPDVTPPLPPHSPIAPPPPLPAAPSRPPPRVARPRFRPRSCGRSGRAGRVSYGSEPRRFDVSELLPPRPSPAAPAARQLPSPQETLRWRRPSRSFSLPSAPSRSAKPSRLVVTA